MNIIRGILKIVLVLVMSINMGWSFVFDLNGANYNDYDYHTAAVENTDYVAAEPEPEPRLVSSLCGNGYVDSIQTCSHDIFVESFEGYPQYYTGSISGIGSYYQPTPEPNQNNCQPQQCMLDGIGPNAWNDNSAAHGSKMYFSTTPSSGGSPASTVYAKNITVTPNTNYRVSYYYEELNNNSAGQYAKLDLRLNGVSQGVVYAQGNWKQKSVTWNSGGNTNLQLLIHNNEGGTLGNNFKIDYIRVEDLTCVGGETCDDGNTVDGDGCSSDCQVEELLDTDGDNIPDSIDIDDDNDGILDTDECSLQAGNTICVD